MNQKLRIVITGVTSFIGVHLVKYFIGLGYEVTTTLSRPQNQYSDQRLDRLNFALQLGAHIEVLDITCQAKVKEFINRLRPTYWIHHAGWARNYQSFDYDLTKAHSINLEPLEYIYPALKNAGCLGLILTGSSAEYSDTTCAALESHLCAPKMPYGLAKLSQTLRANQLAEQYLLPTRVARVFIPFGPMDAPEKLVPSVLKALRANIPVSLTVCSQIRDFLFIDELVSGYGSLIRDLQRKSNFDIFNLSSGQPVTLKDFLLEIACLLKADAKLLKFGDRLLRDGDIGSSWGDNSKAQSILGWKPDSLKKGIVRYLNNI